MKFSSRPLLYLALLVCGLGPFTLAQEGPLDTAPPKDTTPDDIIKRFAAKETEFSKARDQYTYRQDVKVQTVDGDTVDGEYREVFDVMFNDKGQRIENVVFAPQSSLSRIFMSQEDLSDIRHRLPFVLTEEQIPEYNMMLTLSWTSPWRAERRFRAKSVSALLKRTWPLLRSCSSVGAP